MTSNQVVELVVSKCSLIADKWLEHRAFWGDSVAGVYNDINVVAHYLVEQYELGQTGDFEAIFDAVESVLVKAEDEIKTLIIVGLFEDIQNIASHKVFSYEPFEKWLGPISRKYWHDIGVFWEHK
ncbi:hypothetical protein J8M21_22310 [Pseudoalteromonas luteoviolacea]|uniref:DUF7674 family protein n=1 Tax=Pseudoalteromonas luteoviolacea TaxID=43657 RepID=UPI001B3A3A11|nr:hypothetical protein [Pseudoalteromonas luteoviolacea]MBQ4879949.1 hypothetical protein [Pseudoalteromonas luteoviolacea]MBQ4908966.1 hypothetical protein [Pseudoalteromonas luteoviolacea]